MAQHIEVKEKLAMIIECPRCCLYYSIKLVNLIMLFFGIAIIIYSLWLDKKWHQFFSQLHPTSPPPFPWFIYTCLGVGIVVFLSTLCYYIAFNSISNYTICAYIFIACCLLFLEVAVIVIIFFKMDVVAMNAVALSVIFWAAGMEPRTGCNQSNVVSGFTQSFLVPNFPEPDDASTQLFRRCEILS
ncbi:tetraspanin-19 isoform X3 [Manihot esculenta]|uniref:Uncharacterized protein n=1 Tax=Manihot esculenta TaxID=3983 RepID=A0A2C9W556_MANES|nr:tetraspanin-19 isoform X3 [Manihot esculenta]OAY54302.2 hypothetical protein MANES_03G061200v8 [Manihot esculenta]